MSERKQENRYTEVEIIEDAVYWLPSRVGGVLMDSIDIVYISNVA